MGYLRQAFARPGNTDKEEEEDSEPRSGRKLRLPNERWSVHSITDQLEDGRAFRTLALVDQSGREYTVLEPDFTVNGKKVAACLDRVAAERSLPNFITVDNGAELKTHITRHLSRYVIEFLSQMISRNSTAICTIQAKTKTSLTRRNRLLLSKTCSSGTTRQGSNKQ